MKIYMNRETILLPAGENQARGIAQYAIDFLNTSKYEPAESVYQKVEQFHLDSIACSVAAFGMNAPQVLLKELYDYEDASGVPGFGKPTDLLYRPEKAILLASSAARELDSNGTNFGYNPRTGYTRGEFGHNDFYPVAIAAAQLAKQNGRQTLKAMICLDEIRGRLAEVFGLKDHKIDHVVHGAIASAAVYGAMLGATAKQIESAIGMFVAHYIPFRAIRAGHQLSDSKGASAAISTEAAVVCMQRSMRGFVGPADIFRNPQAIFNLFEPPAKPDCSPFDLELATGGDDFAVMGMHFKLGLYEHQSAGAIEGLIRLVTENPSLLQSEEALEKIKITIYEPAFGIIGDPAKRDPKTRQSADHSMVYIIGTLLRKALETKQTTWEDLILLPADYDDQALYHPLTRKLMEKIEFQHGGAEYDEKYPDGIPTTLEIKHQQLGAFSSGLVMYPEGHARSNSGNLEFLLKNKFRRLAALGVGKEAEAIDALWNQFTNLSGKNAEAIWNLYDFPLQLKR